MIKVYFQLTLHRTGKTRIKAHAHDARNMAIKLTLLSHILFHLTGCTKAMHRLRVIKANDIQSAKAVTWLRVAHTVQASGEKGHWPPR